MLRQRHKIAMLVAEFLGAGVLTLVALAITVTMGNPYFIAIGAGVTVAALVALLGRVSGGHFNPAITLGMLSARRFPAAQAVVYVAAQLLGGIAAYALFAYLTNQGIKSHGHYDPRILVSEATGAFVLALGVAATVYNRLEGTKAAGVVGSALAVGVLCASLVQGGIINPAIALGFHQWVWGTYVLGPVLGAVIGFNLYALLFAPAAELIKEEAALEAAEAPKKKK
jgi:glycerol uptake facilitator-like aquaporin